MKRSSGIRLCVTVAVSALSLALITGCSDGGSDDAKDSGKDSGKGSTKALTAAELKKLIIAKGEVDGYEVAAAPKSISIPKSGVTVDKEQCRPLAWAMTALAPGDAAAATSRMVTEAKPVSASASPSKSLEDLSEEEFDDAWSAALSRTVTFVGLSSYDGDGAAKTFKSVSDAIGSCSSGYTLTPGTDGQKYTKIAAEKASGTGDESVAFAASGEMDEADGQTGTVHTEVVRRGSTLVTYYTVNLGALMSDKAYDVPSAVIDAQTAKLK
ncbi:hypothetical protein ACFWP5_22760 [Streptomyces sp. NPDC058469]|uniref:hypothetical protein n=1 Tax=Streptomyces sp. NPDC058469 TaxID=3346514 RepID=UPI003647DC8A